MKVAVILFLLTIECLNAQDICQNKYPPLMSGKCESKENCTGATIVGICKTASLVCCIEDPDANITYPENKFITLSDYTKLVGNSTRALSLYNLFSKALSDARVNTCHQAAAFLAQIQGETNNLTVFHKPLKDASKYDFYPIFGNNQTGDGTKYEDRGAILIRGKETYILASSIKDIKFNLLDEPERAAFPSVAFRIASWFWLNNSYLITSNSTPVKGDLNQLADGSYHNFTLLNHAISTSLSNLKERSIYYEKAVEQIKNCKNIKKGSGIKCEINSRVGYSVPICLNDFKRPYCGCEGEFDLQSCPYGYNSNKQCRNPPMLKCCIEVCNSYLDLVILLDSSGSLGNVSFSKSLNFTKTIVNSLEISEDENRVAFVNFGNDAHVINYLNTTFNKSELIEIVDGIPYLSENTNTQSALVLANNTILTEENGMRPISEGVAKVVVVITDGKSNIDADKTIPNAQVLKKRGVSIISIGVGSSLSQSELEAMASNKDLVFNVDNYDEIFQIFDALRITTCKQPAVAAFEQPIIATVAKNSYKYFALDLEEQSENDTVPSQFSIEVEDLEGRTNLVYSFDDEQPKETGDYVTDSNSGPIDGNYIEIFKNSDEKVTRSTNKNFYTVNKPEGKNKMYVGVKGKANKNTFQMNIRKTLIQSVKTSSLGLIFGIIFGTLGGTAAVVAVLIGSTAAYFLRKIKK